MLEWKPRLGAQLIMSRSLAHHPARNMGQRAIELLDDEHVRTLKTMTANDDYRLATSRVKRIENPPPVLLIPGSMSLLRPASASRISPQPSARR